MNTAEIWKKIRRIEIRTNRLATDVLGGEYQSVFKGQGLEFSDVREYEEGDDIRMIDWNVSARMDRPYVKRFNEERQLIVMLALDISGSLQFGSKEQLKAELATEFCATVAFSAIRNNDRVGLLLFTDRIEQFMAPQKGRGHILRIIREILYTRPQGRHTDLNEALTYLNRVIKRRCVLFVISDFMAPDYSRALRLANQHHDCIAVSIGDRRELELPDVGLIELADPESGEIVQVDLSHRRLREAYQQQIKQQWEERKRLFQSLHLDSMALWTDEPFIRPLVSFFRRREQRH